jgi:hypothetical protein
MPEWLESILAGVAGGAVPALVLPALWEGWNARRRAREEISAERRADIIEKLGDLVAEIHDEFLQLEHKVPAAGPRKLEEIGREYASVRRRARIYVPNKKLHLALDAIGTRLGHHWAAEGAPVEPQFDLALFEEVEALLIKQL